MTFRQIHLGLRLQMGAGQATAEGLEPPPDPAAPLRPLPASGLTACDTAPPSGLRTSRGSPRLPGEEVG